MGSDKPSDGRRDVALFRLATAIALLLAAVGLVAAAGGPFERGWLGHNGARYAQIARNHDRLGLTHLHGAPLLDAGVPDPDRPQVYAHHPPALAWTIALVFRVAGVSEAAACAVPVVATLLLLILFARLVRDVAGPRAAGFALLAAVAQPMLSVYGSHVDVQASPVLLLSLATLAGYRHWLRGGRAAWMLAFAALASAFDWYGLYMPVACAVHLAATQPRRRAAAAGLAGWSLLLFGAWLAWLTSLPGVTLESVFGAAGVRGAGALSAAGADVSGAASAWLSATLQLMPAWPGWLAIAAWVAWRARRGGGTAQVGDARDGEPLGISGLLVLLLLPPVVHALLFPAGMLVHGYWLFALPLPLALAAGVVLSRCPPLLAWACVALLLAVGAGAAQRLLEDRDPLPALVGGALAERTAPADVTLTNYDVNPFVPEASGDRFVLLRPEVTFYSDRVVRGGIGTPEELLAARGRRPDAQWFLLTPWPKPPGPALEAALRAGSQGDPLPLPEDPRVLLFRLRR